MFTILAKILKALNSEAAPWQIGWAIALGVLAGMLPFGLLTILILLIVCIIAINLSTFLLVWGGSASLMLVAANLLESLTWQYAQNPTILTVLSSSEVFQVLRLHHTLVLGAFLLGLLLLWPIAWFGTLCVKLYRKSIMERVMKLKVMKVFQASKIAQIYQQLS